VAVAFAAGAFVALAFLALAEAFLSLKGDTLRPAKKQPAIIHD